MVRLCVQELAFLSHLHETGKSVHDARFMLKPQTTGYFPRLESFGPVLSQRRGEVMWSNGRSMSKSSDSPDFTQILNA